MCIANATDGAYNIQCQYKGFSALMTYQSPNHVHVWCFAHVLNLVLAETTQTNIESGSLFHLLNDRVHQGLLPEGYSMGESNSG